MTRRDVTAFLGKAWIALTLLLGCAPVFLFVGAALLPGAASLWYLFPCLAFALGLVSYAFGKKRRLYWLLFSAAALIALGAWLLPPAGGFASLAVLAASLLLLFALPVGYARPLGEEWPFGMWAALCGTHLLAALLVNNVDTLKPVKTPLAISFAAFALLLALLINRRSLQNGMGDASRPPAAIRRRNIAATLILYAVALIVALWDSFARALRAVADFIIYIFTVVMDFIASLMPASASPGGGGGGGMDVAGMFGDEAAEPSAFALFMEKVVKVVALALLAAAVLFALYFLGKKLAALMKRILARLRAYAAAVGETYTDQSESTFDFRQITQSAREGMGRLLRRREKPLPWKRLDGRARVRRLYREYLSRRAAAPSQTARETLSADKRLPIADAFADAYERARYSDHEVDAAEADKLRDSLGVKT